MSLVAEVNLLTVRNGTLTVCDETVPIDLKQNMFILNFI